jgi:hypothetical protein
VVDLVDVSGNPLQQQKEITRRRMNSKMKKSTPKGDVLFSLTVDLPKELGEDDYLRIMVEYFGIGYESFKGKVR